MAGKARVHELAKELGVTSKEVLARLSEQGEFVKSASSTVEAPVARRLRESFGGAKPAAREGQDRRQRLTGQGRRDKARAAEKAPAAKPAAPPARGSPRPQRPRPRAPRQRRHPRPPARVPTPAQRLVRGPAPTPSARARRAHPARRQQPVLLGAAG